MNAVTTRLEHDLLGDREVPSAAYYGVHMLRALENFDITGISIAVHPDLIRALAQIKQAAAQANLQLGLLDAKRTGAIVAACKEVIDGKWHEQFVVDVIQGGHRHFDQHERQRGDCQPGARNPRSRAW